jgi:hypothetical protein
LRDQLPKVGNLQRLVEEMVGSQTINSDQNHVVRLRNTLQRQDEKQQDHDAKVV